MNKVRSFRDLDVWRKSMDLVEEICKITSEFPKEELFGLTQNTV